MILNYQQAQEILSQHKQEHLLAFYTGLTPAEQNQLLSQISTLNWPLLTDLIKNLLIEQNFNLDTQKLTPPSHVVPLQELNEKSRQEYTVLGEQLITQNKVACLTVAGGEGSRLGHNGPKGSLLLPLNPPQTLFGLMAERLLKLRTKYKASLPWYIMTSPNNHLATVKNFEENFFYGLPAEEVCFFPQAQMPALSPEGKVLLATPSTLALSPNGNGGVFSSFAQCGYLDKVKGQGRTHIFFSTVDNALVKMADPLFLGYTYAEQFPAACKTVRKVHPAEKVGVFAELAGKPMVVEYSDLPEELRLATNSRGQYVYAEGNTAIHCFTVSFLETLAYAPLAYHRAHKKIPCLDKAGNPVHPTQPNGYKFELFMFDGFSLASKMGLLSINREEEFAPIKNPTGDDSPATALALLEKLK